MNMYRIFRAIEDIDPEVYERINTRREAMKEFAHVGKKLSLAALPLALGAMLNKAYGQSNSTASVVDILNYALTLEYLEATFYSMGAAQGSALIPNANDLTAIQKISADETAHVNFLKAVIPQLGGTPVNKPNFDFTANGTFPDVFSNYQTFLAVAQAFEDTGVRAYKGQAANVISNSTVLQAALDIHSVEARHASKIRLMRRLNGFSSTVKPWITGNDTGGIGSSVQPVYAGEDNTIQAGVQITGIGGLSISASAASEAFDEPLDMQSVLAIASLFIKS
ncbi:ferritin-like protein [Thermoflavifilum aggregans]|uniref:Ferritin-like protein n=1 Tax=Thermoflavifilum aggregans TaxID=454188 RepID=A0A2M9CXW8_9BACT|nr:ferritin-like domain-containing protein [Thermoflavifilum aggregans]MBX6379169.1 ferritin-like domain-containing protein [Thermoflavifilum aggregans]PJJ76766.1 ferritin-like protein [Thermoflavifilum aggregans]